MLRIAADDGTATANWWGAAHNVELAALERLPSGTRPELLAHSDDVIVMSDLGDGPSLADLLLGDDARLAEAALLAWARTLGRIAAATGDTTPDDTGRGVRAGPCQARRALSHGRPPHARGSVVGDRSRAQPVHADTGITGWCQRHVPTTPAVSAAR